MKRPRQPARWPIHGFLALAVVAAGQSLQAPAPAAAPQPAGPSLEGDSGWLNTPGPIRLEELRGKVVLLDFWTSSRVGSLHVLPELVKLEEKYQSALVVVGVHSPKYFAERDIENLRRVVRESGIAFPVVNDADQVIWRRFHVETWPTVVLIDVDGSYVGAYAGPGNFAPVEKEVGLLVARAKRRKTLDETPLRFFPESEKAEDTPLLFPGKVLADVPGRRLFIADSAHNRLVQSDLQGRGARPIGTGAAGLVDGHYDRAQFQHPLGMCLVGETLYVADTGNHAIRAVDLKARNVSTVAGTGQPSRKHTGAGPARLTPLSTPWDLIAQPGARALLISMAGAHQIWRLDLQSEFISVWAGAGPENLGDGLLTLATFAQPSGLATDGTHLFVADSEASAIRSITLDRRGQRVHTLIGHGLGVFDDIDGIGDEVRLQHCLDVAYGEGKLYIADTYNNKIKVCDPRTQAVETLVGARQADDSDNPPRFYHPGGVSMAHPHLYVADTNNHKVKIVDLKEKTAHTVELAGLNPPPAVPRTPEFPGARELSAAPAAARVRPGAEITLDVTLVLEKGVTVNPAAPMPYLIETPGRTGLLSDKHRSTGSKVSPPSPSFTITVPLAKPAAAGDAFALKLSLAAPVSTEGSNLCTIKSYVWAIPVTVASNGGSRIALSATDQ